ncbi:MAG: NUMOD3 domain-containing DNA-binding protein [Nitrosotalea sp.]
MRRVNRVLITCQYCGNQRAILQSRIDADAGKYCNHQCHSNALKGKVNVKLQEGRARVKGELHPLYGKHLTEEHRKKISENHADVSGKNSASWKGDNVGYAGIHDWIERELGKPQHCEKCGSMRPQRYEWANRSRKYKRQIDDWVRLCVSCHRFADYHRLSL